jgi:NAD(P)H-flavin reductase
VDEEVRFSYAPGQFTMLYVFGVGEVPISISGDPAEPRLLVQTIRAVGTVTQALRKLRRGDVVGVRGPYGSAWPIQEAVGSDVIIVAGGLGLAPLRPALYAVLSHRAEYGAIALVYGARTPQDMLYVRELEHWRSRFDISVEVTVDSAAADWGGHVGVVTTLIPSIQFDPFSTIALVCGPEIMMRFTVQELFERGLTSEQIFVSLERNMKCAVGFCGHCQFGPHFVCKDGPVFRYEQIQPLFGKREI